METKGKRVLRAAGPAEPPAQAPVPRATPVASSVTMTAPAPSAASLASAAAEADTLAPPTAATVSPAAADPPAPVLLAEPPPAASCPAGDFADFGYQALAALTELQAALARGLEAISIEVAGLSRSGIDRAARTATDMLAIKTFSDAIGVNAVFACASFDTLIDGSAKLSELGIRLAAESSQPILTRFGKGWIAAAAAHYR